MAGGDSPGVKLTYRDYCRFPDDGKRHEILDGEHYVTPAPRPPHQSVLTELILQIRTQVGKKRVVYTAPIDVHLSDVDVVQPDLVVIAPERRHILTPSKVKGAPDLVVEVLSPSTEARDRGLKSRRYAAAGVPEYCIVDLEEHVVEQHVLESGKYRLVGVHEDEVQARAPGLAHVRLDLRELW